MLGHQEHDLAHSLPESGKLSKGSRTALLFSSAMTPFGIVASASIARALKSSAALWFQGLASSFASGCFIFVGLTHLAEARKLHCDGQGFLLRTVPELLGFGLMAVVGMYA